MRMALFITIQYSEPMITRNFAVLELHGKRETKNNILIFGMKKSFSIRTVCILISGILFAVVFNSCKTTQKPVDYKDLSYLYNPTKSRINPRYNIINQTDESSVLSVRFSNSDLFFSEANPEGVPIARPTPVPGLRRCRRPALPWPPGTEDRAPAPPISAIPPRRPRQGGQAASNRGFGGH